ncbi:MAG TPA: GTPase Era [Actinomycetota bacterium]|nr:GTPase Era [Actinomycetota bacterium]
MGFRSGFVAVVGRPNVGKSTLVNALVGQKVAIVSDKPQTTRRGIRGVRTTDDYQVVFTDTPGFHKPRTLLGRRLNEVVAESVEGVDLIVQVVDAAAGVGRGDAYVYEHRVAPHPVPKLCAVNKIDLVRHHLLPPQLQAAADLGDFDEIVPVSAREGKGVGLLLDLIVERLPEGPMYYPPGEVTDQPLEVRLAEIVREKALALTREELPHSIAVVVEEVSREGGLTRVEATIVVERDSQKGIVIGRGGAMLKAIGTRAREEMELLLGTKVFLELRVKVLREWQRDPAALARLGL